MQSSWNISKNLSIVGANLVLNASLAETMGLRPAKCAIKYNHRGSRAYAWSGIKAVFDIGKMTMVVFVLCAWLHRIGHYGVLDIASPQSGNVGQQPLSSPHFGGNCGKL